MANFTIKRGDRKPDLSIACTDDDAPVDLTPASSVKILARRAGTLLFSRAVVGTAEGIVTMPWQAEDTDTAGRLEVEVEVTWPDGSPQTFPPDGYLKVDIKPDLG